jgi:hypothetical protein
MAAKVKLIQEQMLATVCGIVIVVPVTHQDTHQEEVGNLFKLLSCPLDIDLSLYSSLQTAKHGVGCCFGAHAATMNNV